MSRVMATKDKTPEAQSDQPRDPHDPGDPGPRVNGQPVQEWDPQQHAGKMPDGSDVPSGIDPAEAVVQAGRMQADGTDGEGQPNTTEAVND